MADEKLKDKLARYATAILNCFVVLLWGTFGLMLVIILAGMIKIGIGLYNDIWLKDEHGFVDVLHGIEIIFVGPLPHLFIASFAKYISATRIEIGANLPLKKDYMKHAVLEITNAKIFTIGLFISLIFLHVIDLILQKNLDTDLLIYVLPVIAVLIGFYFLLDKVAEKLEK